MLEKTAMRRRSWRWSCLPKFWRVIPSRKQKKKKFFIRFWCGGEASERKRWEWWGINTCLTKKRKMRVYISDFYADAVWRADGHQLRYVLFSPQRWCKLLECRGTNAGYDWDARCWIWRALLKAIANWRSVCSRKCNQDHNITYDVRFCRFCMGSIVFPGSRLFPGAGQLIADGPDRKFYFFFPSLFWSIGRVVWSWTEFRCPKAIYLVECFQCLVPRHLLFSLGG